MNLVQRAEKRVKEKLKTKINFYLVSILINNNHIYYTIIAIIHICFIIIYI